MATNATILIADDDDRVLKALLIRLEKVGFKVITATDGYNALSLTAKHKPDLLVLDVNMPAGDGFSVLERMKEIPGTSNIPVIYVTGDRSSRLDELAEKLGAFAILHKPFHVEELIDTILGAISPQPTTG